MIKVVLCDLGNVIVFFDDKKIAHGFAKFSDKDEEYIHKFFLNSMARKRFDVGKITAKQLFADFKNKLNLKIGFSQFKKIWCSCFTGVNKDMMHLLNKLKKNYKLVLLSNTDEIHFTYLNNKHHLTEIFDDFVLSYKVGHMKPSPGIYLHALKKAREFPTKVVYIDDIKTFVTASKLFGIKGIHYTNFEKLKKELRRLNINA